MNSRSTYETMLRKPQHSELNFIHTGNGWQLVLESLLAPDVARVRREQELTEHSSRPDEVHEIWNFDMVEYLASRV